MAWTLFGRIILLCALFFALASTVYPNELTRDSPALKLPDIVFALRILQAKPQEFEELRRNPNNTLLRLERNLEELHPALPSSLAMQDRSFIIQNVKDHWVGFPRFDDKSVDDSGVPKENFLFVTTPIESYGNKILIVISYYRPSHTTVVSVDENLKCRLLYDSSAQTNKVDLSPIYYIRSLGAGEFLLEGRIDQNLLPFYKPFKCWAYILKVSDGKGFLLNELSNKSVSKGYQE